MTRIGCLLVFCVCVACGAAPAAPANAQAPAVLLVQIDGLSVSLLDDYRRRTSLTGDRPLARIGTMRTVAVADIGIDAPTAAATLIAEAPPATLTADTPVLFDLLPGAGIAAGFPAGERARAIVAETDAARVDAVLAAAPAQLVAVRLTGLAEALSQDGLHGSHRAIATIDTHLARLYARQPGALLIVVGTSAMLRQGNHDEIAGNFAKYLKVAPDAVRSFGDALRVQGLDRDGVAALDGVDSTLAVFHRTPDGVKVFDDDLRALRAVHAREFPTRPNLLARLERALSVGETLLVNRTVGFDFRASAQPSGATSAESRVPILFAGREVRGSAAGVGVADVAGLIRAALMGGPNTAWQALSARPPRACNTDVTCAVVVARTDDLSAAADALVVAQAYDAARWLDPSVPLPTGESASPSTRVAASRYAFGDETRSFTPVDITVPSAAHAAMIARVTGAEVVAWHDSAIVPVAYIEALGGPAFFSGPLPHADDYAALSRGVRALRRGDFETAYVELGEAKGHTPDAEVWRRVLYASAGHHATGINEPPEYPADLRGWPRIINAMLQTSALPTRPDDASTKHKALYAAFEAIHAPQTRSCGQVDARLQVQTLRRSQATFEAAGLPGLAGLSAIKRAYLQANLQADFDAARASIQEALALSDHRAAAPTRSAILEHILSTAVALPKLAKRLQPELDAASAAQLLWAQTRIVRARAHEKAGVSYLLGLTDGVAISRRPDLFIETIDLAIAGQSETAAAVVQALLTSRGLTSLLQPDAFKRLQVSLLLMERALQTAPAGDGPNVRVARAMPPIVRAVLHALRGSLPLARQALATADALLPMDAIFMAREAAVQAAGEVGDPTIAAWGPLTKALVLAGRLVAAVMVDDRKDAENQALSLIELSRRFAHAELGRARVKGFKAPVDRLSKVLIELVSYAMLPEVRRKLATGRILKTARAFPLDVPHADPKIRPWLRLAGIAVNDMAWILAAKRDDALLKQPIAAMEALVAAWRPKSRLGTVGLYLLLAVQYALPDLGALIQSDHKSVAIQTLPHVRNALQTVAQALREQYPKGTIVAALRQGEAERVFIEHFLRVLETPALLSGDGLPAALATTNAQLRAAVGGTPGDVRDVLLLVETLLTESQGQYTAALRWAKTGADGPSGTAFASLPGLWSGIAAGINSRKGDHKAAIAALKRASKACPAVAHRFTLAMAVHQAASGAWNSAKKTFRAARYQSRKAGNGGVDTVFSINVPDNLLNLQADIQNPILGTLLGRSNGNVRVQAMSGTKHDRLIGWHLAGHSSPADAAIEALTLESWLALNRRDYHTAGTALSGIVSVLHGIDPRHIDGISATDLPTMPARGAFFPRSARMVLWTTILAEQHGFKRLAGSLTQAISKHAQANWVAGPGGRLTVCEDEVPESASPIIKKMQCDAPAPLVHLMGGEEGARAMEGLVRARLSAADLAVPQRALAEALPTWVPQPGTLAALEAVKAGVDVEETVRAAIKAGFVCELLYVDRPAVQAQLIGETHVCGPLPRRIRLAQAAISSGDATTILDVLREGLRIEHAIAPNGRFAQAVWPLARKTMSAAAERESLAQRAAAWRTLAQELNRPSDAAWFEALRLASTPTPATAEAEKALIAAWRAGLRTGPALKYFKQVMAGNSAAAQAELLK